jgi:hypothetical protein
LSFPKMTGMMYCLKEQGNVSALVQIFNAIPPPSFSAPAELRIINPTTDPYIMLILISYFLFIVLNTSSASDKVGFPQRTVPEG